MNRKIKKAIFPVAGLGTRFLPATKVLPKEMMPIFNQPIIQYAVREAMEAGIEEFIFVTGRGKVLIEDHFDISYELEDHLLKKQKEHFKQLISKDMPKPGKAFFTRQQHPLGLGHAISCAKSFLGNEPFAVLLPDEYLLSDVSCLKNMVDFYEKTQSNDNVIATQKVSLNNVSSYGILSLDETYKNEDKNILKINSLVEKPRIENTPSQYAIIGRYILQPTIFEYLDKAIIGAGGEIQLTDAIDYSIKQNNTYAYIFEGKRFDCGNPVGLVDASLEVALRSHHKDQVLEIIKNKLKEFS